MVEFRHTLNTNIHDVYYSPLLRGQPGISSQKFKDLTYIVTLRDIPHFSILIHGDGSKGMLKCFTKMKFRFALVKKRKNFKRGLRILHKRHSDRCARKNSLQNIFLKQIKD